MYKIAILCQSLRNYAGAERVVYELTQAFIRESHQVHLGCIDIGDFYHQQLAGVRINDLVGGMDDEYDLIICFHTHTLPYFFPNGIICRKLCFFSLSPYEPIESPPCSDHIFDSYLCNSDETKEELLKCGIPSKKIYIFHNACKFQSEVFELKQTLNRVAIVSNHPPKELLELPSLESNLHFDFYGSTANVEMLNDFMLAKYDVIITIGYTVVFAISAKVPVYIYDHFGGDGYLNSDNFVSNSYYNFSGRPNCNKKEAFTILQELKDGFNSTLKSFQQVYESMRTEREIALHINKLLDFSGIELKTVSCDLLQVKHALAYSKLLMSNRFLQKIVDGCENSAISQNIINLSDAVMHQARLIEKINDQHVILNNKINTLNKSSDLKHSRLNEHGELLKSLSDFIKSNHNDSLLIRVKRKIKKIIHLR
ncbi:hypothetical protein [Aeromonas enteropelogenes]|uniref:hypothetical protein n=1 Tax=Aeromonas enteropelogenes TaxID=29489 RepID=UPI003BA24F33